MASKAEKWAKIEGRPKAFIYAGTEAAWVGSYGNLVFNPNIVSGTAITAEAALRLRDWITENFEDEAPDEPA